MISKVSASFSGGNNVIDWCALFEEMVLYPFL